MTAHMNQPEARALANFLSRIRNRSGGIPWDAHGIEYALAEARDMADPYDLAVAAIRATQEPINKTPAVIGMRGPHWREATGPVRMPPEPTALLCSVCGKSEQTCRSAYVPSMPDAHRYQPIKDNEPVYDGGKIATLRKIHEQGRAKLCPVHGAAICDTCPGFGRVRTSSIQPTQETSP
jgi:hypothetical protein